MTKLRTWEDELRDRGAEVLRGPAYECPACGHPRHAFTIALSPGGEWQCSGCLSPAAKSGPPEPTWEDVRGVRAVFMQASDWTQLADVPLLTRRAWGPLRQRARDVGAMASPAEAMKALRSLQEEAGKL